MAITINVGGSKKVSKNYDSQGVSLNVTAEVPNDALREPDMIAATANDLFELVRSLLDEQINKLAGTNGTTTDTSSNGGRHGRSTQAQESGPTGHRSTNSRGRNGNGNGNGSNSDRRLTQAQERAIHNMAGRVNENADRWASDEFGTDGVQGLTVRQASKFIDILKGTLDERPAASEVAR